MSPSPAREADCAAAVASCALALPHMHWRLQGQDSLQCNPAMRDILPSWASFHGRETLLVLLRKTPPLRCLLHTAFRQDSQLHQACGAPLYTQESWRGVRDKHLSIPGNYAPWDHNTLPSLSKSACQHTVLTALLSWMAANVSCRRCAPICPSPEHKTASPQLKASRGRPPDTS